MFKLVLLSVFANVFKIQAQQTLVGNPLMFFHPCDGNNDIIANFEQGLPPGEENQYHVFMNFPVSITSRLYIKFDSEATVKLVKSSARISEDRGTFVLNYYKGDNNTILNVRGPARGTVPYITNITLNGEQLCNKPTPGNLENYIFGNRDTAESHLTVPDETCGRRKIQYTELITNGLTTRAGDWPWHAAIYRVDGSSITYICGGTLLSKSVVLTAGHCTLLRGVLVLPEVLSVVLGKYNLKGGDIASQEREIHEIVLHEDFKYDHLDNDIAILKLRSAVEYTNYVQPACLWYRDAYKKLPTTRVFGTVVGWGFDHTDRLSSTLHQATMPKVSESACLKSNPVFFSQVLNDKKFCAGWNNGTSACNGDSGGGFVVFVPDVGGNDAPNATGAWHVRGIVSLSIRRPDAALCDPNQYVLFTDLAKFRGWIESHSK